MPNQTPITIVYPPAASIFYEDLARRLMAACEELQREAVLRSSADVTNMEEEQLCDATLLIVNPQESLHKVGDHDRYFSRLSAGRKRVMVLAEAVGFEYFEKQFELPLKYDMLIDVGFSSQKDKLGHRDIPYRFLFNGPDQEEKRRIAAMSPSQRRIPWAVIGHHRPSRARLVEDLIGVLGPDGVVFLPTGGAVREGRGTIGPSGLGSTLSHTRFYVWQSLHEFTYYESFRFREAVMAGAVPCKIDSEVVWKELGIPGIFRSVRELAETVRSEGFDSMWRSARDFYLSRGSLSDHLDEILNDV